MATARKIFNSSKMVKATKTKLCNVYQHFYHFLFLRYLLSLNPTSHISNNFHITTDVSILTDDVVIQNRTPKPILLWHICCAVASKHLSRDMSHGQKGSPHKPTRTLKSPGFIGLKLLKNDILNKLANILFNIPFSAGVFTIILKVKVLKVVPVHK